MTEVRSHHEREMESDQGFKECLTPPSVANGDKGIAGLGWNAASSEA